MTDTFRPPHVRRLLEQLPEDEARVVREFMDTFGAALVEGQQVARDAAGSSRAIPPHLADEPCPSASAAQLGLL